MARSILFLLPLLATSAGAASAQADNHGNQALADQARPEAFQALVRCRAITEDAARLHCFDTAAAALEQAANRHDVVVVDRGAVRESRRRLFGLALPSLPIFGGYDGQDDAADEVRSIEGVVQSAQQNDLGQWFVHLQDGGYWIQTDFATLALRPRPGQHVVINRGVLGSFSMRVNGQPGIRVRRSL